MASDNIAKTNCTPLPFVRMYVFSTVFCDRLVNKFSTFAKHILIKSLNYCDFSSILYEEKERGIKKRVKMYGECQAIHSRLAEKNKESRITVEKSNHKWIAWKERERKKMYP